ncbi:Hypothetical predicted protein [Pelobates cultripes]|uniref:Uncharacterized protein n=1 Tax=Pelobates cultripes TaxID=61616 RepID=A0AAD1SDG4_PELCU|nr:Hypothetical predicted protein [Pelobates cultripes]
MAPAPSQGQENTALERIEGTLRELTTAIATKADLQAITATIQETLRTEVAGLRTELAAHAGRIAALEEADTALTARVASTDIAVARQGEMLLTMRRHLEDVDNRGRRCNIRVRGVPEAEGADDVQDTLQELFHLIMQPSPPPQIEFERAHRALRPGGRAERPHLLSELFPGEECYHGESTGPHNLVLQRGTGLTLQRPVTYHPGSQTSSSPCNSDTTRT